MVLSINSSHAGKFSCFLPSAGLFIFRLKKISFTDYTVISECQF